MSRWRQLCRDISSIAQALNRIANSLGAREMREEAQAQRDWQSRRDS